MWAEQVLRMRAALPEAEQTLAVRRARATCGCARPPRRSTRCAGPARRSTGCTPGWPSSCGPGRTEREVGRDIAAAILDEGHATVDFVIVGSGPNGAIPHHEVGDRVIETGDVVVVDIGGTTPEGYCSDCTRMYALGEPPAEFVDYFRVLHEAQLAACAHARPGVTRRVGRRGGPRR